MNTYQFTLVLQGVSDETHDLEDKIFESGFSDTLVHFRNGAVYLDFDRASSSFEEAVISSIKQIESALPKARVIQVAPEHLVSEAEISKRLTLTRQAVSLWIQGKKRNKIPFPTPIMKLSEKSPLWKWSDVCEWLYSNEMIQDHALVEQSIFIENVNAALEERCYEVREVRHSLVGRLASYPPKD